MKIGVKIMEFWRELFRVFSVILRSDCSENYCLEKTVLSPVHLV